MSAGRPVLARTREELARARAGLSGEVGAVLTMGALHAGHRALLRAARAGGGPVVASIFVNPLQFGPAEDYARYPRSLEADLVACAEEGVALVFAPPPEVVYPDGAPSVRVCAGELGARFEGASRPGHFDGVLTVVTKLLHLLAPAVSFFGEKDAQQLALVRRCVRDLDLPVRIVAVPTVRESDGLAVSSRNAYLSAAERAAAAALPEALRAGAARTGAGAAAVREAAAARLAGAPDVRPDYLAVVDEEFTELADGPVAGARLIAAARVGATRLIDNVAL